MIKDIKELNFPKYATLETASATIADMGDRTVTSQVKIDGDVVPDFSYDWEVEFKGERYIHPVRTPQGTKDNASRKSKIDLVFQHWAIYEMKRQYFVEMASTTAGTAIADKYIASLGLNLGDFVTAFNLVLNHYFGGSIVIRLNPEWQYDAEAKFVTISYSYIWDVLQQMHEIYGVRWTLKTNADGVCEILMGYPSQEVSHIFEYGFEGGLLSVQRQVQSTEIRNRLLGRGGSKNLPYRYFKDKDPNNPLFEADPDWIPELANVAFTELRGKSFRDYVRGWKARHYDGNAMEEPTEAYLAGYNAEKFDPIEYVEDKDSIAKYGVLVGALQNNEDIYPSIQGAPGDVDMIVDAEQVTDDDVDSAVENDSVTTNLESGHQTYRNAPANSTVTIETLTKRYFSVPEGKVGNLSMSLTATGKYSDFGDYEETHPILKSDTVKVTIHDKITGAEVKLSSVPVVNIPAGDYYYMISVDVETNYDRTSMVTLNIESVYLYTSTPNKSEGWKQTFDIWVRNIWGSSRNAGETDQQYADRVWLPILGDRMGNEARVVFASGWLSFSSDWEFPIVGYAYDDSKEGSHWRLTLAKSEAELEASGKYIPYEGYNASAGDRFFFIGIDMPYEYVIWAEERLDDFKRDSLMQTAEINPAWVIKTDKVRLNQDREGAVLVDSLNAGSQIRLASKQFISGAYETLYVQSLTYKWTADTIMYPDVEVVVSDKAVVVKNPVAQIQSNIEAIQRQVGSMSNLQQIIRQICDKLYLRKDGISDVSKSPTKFLGKVTGENFRQGQIGGRDWGIYRDENGNAILEADKLVARQGILVTDLVVNEATYVGGLQIRSAAHMDVTSVEDTEAGYVCSFDQKQGSVTNKFTEDDVVLCQKFDADQSEVKFYKRRVVSVSETSVTLSKTDVNGTGVPAEGDVIIHYGNYTDKSRQFVIISDVIGGGYERMLMGLDSVASDGVEYYFAGKSADSKARWFVGGAEQYAEYKDGQLTIKGNIFVTGSDQSINEQIAQLDFIRNAFGENAQGLILGTAIVVGYNDDEGKFVPMAGLSGVYDKEADNGGPAAWYGGTPEKAKSVIFMDGTGYFADGLFKWDKDKGVNLGNGAVWINYDGSVDFGDQIRIGASGDETLGSLLTIVATLADIWKIDEETGDLVTDRNVIIKKNVTIGGDTSTGGTGENPGVSGTVTGIRVDANTVLKPTNGIVDMSDVLANLEVDVDLSDYYTALQTDAQIANAVAGLNLGQYATTASLAILQTEVDNIESVLGMDEEAEGIINTWNEVKAFLGTIEVGEDLTSILERMNADIATRALDSDLDTLALTVGDNTTNIRNLKDSVYTKDDLATYKSWWDDLMGLIVKEGSDIKINGNLIVAGDTSSTSQGTDVGGGGILGINVNGETYDKPVNGILTIPDYPTSLEWSAINGKPTKLSEFLNDSGFITSAALVGYATQSWVEGKGYITGIDKSMVASAVGASGNAGKVLSSTGGDLGWISLPTSLPASDVYAWAKASTKPSYTTTEVSEGANLYFTNARAVSALSGTLANYLPLTGGTLEGNLIIGTEVNSLTTQRYIYMWKGDGTNRHRCLLGVNEGGVFLNYCCPNNGKYSELLLSANGIQYLPNASTKYDIIHSGNIGSYAALYNEYIFGDNSVNALGYSYAANSGLTQAGPTMVFGKGNYRAYLFGRNGVLRFNTMENGALTGWKTIAFTDSTVAAANKLVSGTTNTLVADGVKLKGANGYYIYDEGSTWFAFGSTSLTGVYQGISLQFKCGSNVAINANSSGNVTIGSSDLALTNYKLWANGSVRVSNGTYSDILEFDDNGGRITFWNGSYHAGTIEASKLILNAATKGNVLIGTSTDSGYKLAVAGNEEVLNLSNPTGGNVGIRFSRSTNTSWSIKVSGGNLYINENNSGTTRAVFYESSQGGSLALTGKLTAGDTVIDGSLGVTSAVAMSSTLSVNGVATFNGTLINSTASPLRLTALGTGTYNVVTLDYTSNGLILERARKTDSGSGAIVPLIISQRGGGGVAAKFDGNDFYVAGNTNVGGNLVVAGDTATGSDIRFKDRIADHRIALSDIANAPLFTFKWNDREDDSVHLGSSAQYWEKVAPWLVKGTDFKVLDYSTLGVAIGISLANKALNHEKRIKILEKENEQLKEQIRRIQYGS